MNNSNEYKDKDLDTIKNELFDPNDVSRWLSYSRQDFINVMVHELKRETITIEKYAELMKQSTEIQSTEITMNGQHISAILCVEVMLNASRMLMRLIDTTSAYNHQVE